MSYSAALALLERALTDPLFRAALVAEPAAALDAVGTALTLDSDERSALLALEWNVTDDALLSALDRIVEAPKR